MIAKKVREQSVELYRTRTLKEVSEITGLSIASVFRFALEAGELRNNRIKTKERYEDAQVLNRIDFCKKHDCCRSLYYFYKTKKVKFKQ